jgi:uncharacterized membrane protein YidH (DUF202 family)
VTSKPPKQDVEKRLQIFFGAAIALVVIGVIVFVALVVQDLQHH